MLTESRISVYIKFFLGSVSQSLSSGSTLERAHHTAWLSNWCSVFYPTWSGSYRLLPALYRLAVCTHSNVTKRVKVFHGFHGSLKSRSTHYDRLEQNTTLKAFTIFQCVTLIILPPACPWILPLPFLPIQTLNFTPSLWGASMQPSLIFFPPPGSDLFCFRLSRCFLFNCYIELTIFYPARK